MKKSRKSFSLAVSGVFTAFSIVFMLIANVIPTLSMVAPSFASLFVFVVLAECGTTIAVMLYIAISLLGMILVPDKTIVLWFILLFGHYPLLKVKIEQCKSKLWAYVIKFLLLNSLLAVTIALFHLVFPVASGSEELETLGIWMLLIYIVLGQVAFFFYDRLLTNLLKAYPIYMRRFLPKHYRRK